MAHAAITKENGSDSKGPAFEVICPECGTVGSADEEWLADLVGRLHDAAFSLAVAAGKRNR